MDPRTLFSSFRPRPRAEHCTSSQSGGCKTAPGAPPTVVTLHAGSEPPPAGPAPDSPRRRGKRGLDSVTPHRASGISWENHKGAALSTRPEAEARAAPASPRPYPQQASPAPGASGRDHGGPAALQAASPERAPGTPAGSRPPEPDSALPPSAHGIWPGPGPLRAEAG